ncbi:exported hypothetical protein [uncultured Mycobacterium sp.]|uniref:Uncharacterized protein n=1 Tax=uncultured Mycobacterium sp. TaxID=171292 RepID=A0A1Y5PGR6_9MYCO|nr:exported hypothetical protein [uncultured Mycobacterium sp.]
MPNRPGVRVFGPVTAPTLVVTGEVAAAAVLDAAGIGASVTATRVFLSDNGLTAFDLGFARGERPTAEWVLDEVFLADDPESAASAEATPQPEVSAAPMPRATAKPPIPPT